MPFLFLPPLHYDPNLHITDHVLGTTENDLPIYSCAVRKKWYHSLPKGKEREKAMIHHNRKFSRYPSASCTKQGKWCSYTAP